MEDLSLHIMDLVDNSIAAGCSHVRIEVREDPRADRLYIEISDDGKGMDRRTLRRAVDPLFTSKSGKSVGLGLSLFAQAARESGGELSLDSRPGRGTRVRGAFGLRHVDRKPLGDVAKTLRVLQASHPEIRFEYRRSLIGEEGTHETQA